MCDWDMEVVSRHFSRETAKRGAKSTRWPPLYECPFASMNRPHHEKCSFNPRIPLWIHKGSFIPRALCSLHEHPFIPWRQSMKGLHRENPQRNYMNAFHKGIKQRHPTKGLYVSNTLKFSLDAIARTSPTTSHLPWSRYLAVPLE